MLNWPDYIGEAHFKEDSKPDEIVKLFAGDVIHIEEGSNYTFTSPTGAKRKIKSYKLPIW